MKKSFKNIEIEELAGIIGNQLEKYEINAVLTGGACVSVYSENKYQSMDLDFVSVAVESNSKELIKAMREIGFELRTGGYFERADSPFIIEFLPPPLAIGGEPVKDVKVFATKYGSFKILRPTDCVKDRLAHYLFWNDPQGLEQARMVADKHKIDFKEIKRWAKAENQLEKYKAIVASLKKRT